MNKLATILLCVNFITVLFPQPGYIHPDEFFQSTEVVAGDVLNVSHFRAWEFEANFPVRSIVFPYVVTSPPLYLLQMLNATQWPGLQISTVKLVMSTRLPLAFLSVFGYLATGKLADTFQVDKYLSAVLYCSSYVTWTYYTRTFSNSVESVLLAIVFLLTLPTCATHTEGQRDAKTKSGSDGSETEGARNKENQEGEHCIQKEGEKKKTPEKPKQEAVKRQSRTLGDSSASPFLLGVVIAAGIFNRPTFVVFALIPLLLWLTRRLCLAQPNWHGRLVTTCSRLTCGAVIASAVFVTADTIYYKPAFVKEVKMFLYLLSSGEMSVPLITKSLASLTSSLVVTPLNFLLYNTDASNLAQHGLHPRVLHFFVNLPLLLGPIYISFIFVTIASVYQLLFGQRASSTGVISDRPAVCWMVLMAVVPTLALSVFPHQEPRFLIPALPVFMVMGAKFVSALAPAKLSFLVVWLVFNIVLTLVYGYMHQAALIPALSIYQQKLASLSSKPSPGSQHAIFYKTYPPPRHLLLLPASASQHVHIHDLAGGPVTSVLTAVQDSKLQCKKARGSCQIFLFVPSTVTPWVEDKLSQDFKLQTTSICPHLSMEAAPRLKAWWRKKIGFEEFLMEFCLNIIKIS